MVFDFSTAGRIVFGLGAFEETKAWLPALGRRVLVVGGFDQARYAPLIAALAADGRATERAGVAGEPSVADVERLVAKIHAFGADSVVAFGGGSALDAGKAAAALATNPGPIADYLEIIGRGLPLEKPPLPMVAVPTTAGTGAEVTRNAVLNVPERHVKVSLRGPFVLPKLALVDPMLCLALPPKLTAATGMDAITQLIEAYVSCRANPLSDGFALTGLHAARWGLRAAYQDGSDPQAREAMALAALMSGLALTSAGLGVVHGFASPIGGAFPIAHGEICAALLAPAMLVNIRAVRERAPDGEALARFTRVAQLLTDRPEASPEEGVEWVRRLVAELGLAGIARQGVSESFRGELGVLAARSNSMKGNPIPLLPREFADVLRLAG